MKGERMPKLAVVEDPVMLLPAGMTYDRKQICKYLLHHPNLDPGILEELAELLEWLRRQWVKMKLPMTPKLHCLLAFYFFAQAFG
jgi:hypothetical protein